MPLPGPDTRVVELRVHGILGTTPDELTESVASVDVAGDGVGRIVRPADRLLRPVPGPMLSAGDRSVPRIVEGYVWGGMTSGGLSKASWALLFPFALANVAHWMLPPARPGHRVSGLLSAVLRALFRLSALLLTTLFVSQLTVVLLDLVAAQCLRPGGTCQSWVPDAFREVDQLRAFLGLLPVGLVVLLMHRLSRTSWRVTTGRGGTAQHSARAPMLPGANVVTDPDTAALRVLHTTAALAAMALVALGGPFAPSADPRWLVAVLLLVGCAVGCGALDDPTGMTESGGRALRTALSRVPRRVLLTTGAVLVLSVAVLPGPLSGPLPGSGAVTGSITAAMVLSCVAIAVLLLPAAALARPTWQDLPADLRPWAGGWMGAPVLMIACLLGNGFGAGLAFTVRQALDPALVLPATYDDVTLFWGTGAVLAVLAAALGGPWLLIRRWRAGPEEIPEEVALLHAGRKEDQRSAASAWKWAGLQRRNLHRVLLVISGVLVGSTAVTLAAKTFGLPRWPFADWLVGLGVLALAALAVGLLRMVYLAAVKPDAGRYLGVLCDLVLFWPREAHPVVPPCYAMKVIPELAARATEHLADPNTRVVLVGHSQGSLLAAVTTARLLETLPEQDRERVGLVTAGSQLQWAYPRAFPGVVPHYALRDLAGSLEGRWRALCRGTDPIGGAVSTWNRQVYGGTLIGVGFREGSEGPLPPATRGPTGALVLGGDHWLPDPQRGPFACRRWVPGVLGHSDYTGDPEWDRAVAMAAGLESPARGASLPLQHQPGGRGVAPAADSAGAPVSAGDDEPPTPVGAASRDGAEVVTDRVAGNGAIPLDEVDAVPEEETAREPDGPPERPEPAVLPEITEPRARTAPWERGLSLRPSER
ncbi:hypothetical protein [Saccharopolyspora cebuensis]|uniref:Lipase (Class 3) n=1 Tax=Saccharopolyspora cebuensis TaxID=418759 RepID=A0ABV4CLT9_9PSEU